VPVPFTLSHPAAVLPLLGRLPLLDRLPLPAAGLVAGSMAPDVVYFLPHPVPLRSGLTHSAVGLVSLDLLLGAALVVLWLLVRRPLLSLLPAAVAARLLAPVTAPVHAPLGGRPPLLAGLAMVAALLLGAASHVGWDAFTHDHGQVVQRLPALQRDLLGPAAGFTVLQYASSVLGLLAISVVLRRVVAASPPRPLPPGIPVPAGTRAVVLTLLVVAALVSAALRVHAGVPPNSLGQVLARVDDRVPIGLIRGACLGLAAYAAGWHVVRLGAGRTSMPGAGLRSRSGTRSGPASSPRSAPRR